MYNSAFFLQDHLFNFCIDIFNDDDEDMMTMMAVSRTYHWWK
jgi:hypothetical protein